MQMLTKVMFPFISKNTKVTLQKIKVPDLIQYPGLRKVVWASTAEVELEKFCQRKLKLKN